MIRKSVRLSDVRKMLKRSHALELSAAAIQRLKWYAFALEHEGNVSLTCRHFGIVRSTFLRWIDRFDPADCSTLEEHSRRPHTVRVPETEASVVDQVRALRMEFPMMGKRGICDLLKERFRVSTSVSTVGRIISRYHLFFADKPSHQEKRHSQASHDVPEEQPSAVRIHKVSAHEDDGDLSLHSFPLSA